MHRRSPFPSHRRHLPKIFDNIHGLQFELDDQGAPTHRATHMVSGEGEVVPLVEPCNCSSPVEVRRLCLEGGG